MSTFQDALTDLRAEAARARELDLDLADCRQELDAAHARELAWKGDCLAARAEAARLAEALAEALPYWQAAQHPKPTKGTVYVAEGLTDPTPPPGYYQLPPCAYCGETGDECGCFDLDA